MFSDQRFAKNTLDEIQARQVMANVSGAPLCDEGGNYWNCSCLQRCRQLCLSKAVSMAKRTSITIPPEPIGSIPRPFDLEEDFLWIPPMTA